MDLSSIGLPTLPSGTSSALAGKQLANNFDTFLTLLTSQLKNQDPLEPMSSEQFTQQLVQFSQVEQQITTNDHLESLTSLSLASQQAGLVDYIGKTVEGVGNQARLSDGAARWTFDLDGEPETVSILVTNESGRPVFATKTDGQKGENSFAWDGEDSAGNPLPDGIYAISIAAADKNGTSIGSTVRSRGIVDGVEIVDGIARLNVGGNVVPLNQVTSVAATTDTSTE